MQQVSGRIPSLDGLRAISIALVVLSHVIGTRNLPNPGLRTDMMGEFGVRVFFVISGFLITGLLLKEVEKTGRTNLANFYLRRILRIFPAFYVYIAVLFVLYKLGIIDLMRFDLVKAMTYTVNYDPWDHQSRFVRHIWSLSNEEQFYLLWPFAVALFRPRIALQLAATTIVLIPFVRLAVMLTGGSAVLTLDRRFDCVADVLATGCLLAGLQSRLSSNGPYLRFLRSPWFLVVPFVMVASIMTQDHPYPYYLVGQTLANIGIALCIDRVVRFPDGPLGRLLNSSPLRYVGALSYSLYLWQQLFLVPESRAWWAAFPVNIMLVAAASVISFHWIETPFQRMKSKFSRAAPVMVS